MDSEVKGQTDDGSGTMLAGVHERLSWRPRAAVAAESMVSSVMRVVEPSMRSAAKLSSWHNQFTQRVRPWYGWLPLTMAFDDEGTPLERQMETDKVAIGTWEERENVHLDGPPLQRSTISDESSTPGQQARTASYRPAMALAILRPDMGTEPGGREPDGAAFPLDSLLSMRNPERPPTRILSSGEQTRQIPTQVIGAQFLETRIITSVSRSPRHEAPGGFPEERAPSLPFLSEEEQAEMGPIAQWSANTSAAPIDVISQQTIADAGSSSIYRQLTPLTPAEIAPARPASADSPATRDMADRVQPAIPEAQGAIERLIERTVIPTPLPGFELRMVPPQEAPPQDSKSEEQPEENLVPPVSALVQPEAHQVDIDEVADKVYQTLVRRQQLERERKGLY